MPLTPNNQTSGPFVRGAPSTFRCDFVGNLRPQTVCLHWGKKTS